MATELSPAKLYERAEKAARVIRARTDADVPVAIVLGSGLGAFADELTDSTSIRYDEIPSFARATVEGHAGRLVIGKTNNVTVAAMQGRFHFYEGYSLEEVTFPIRVLKLLGVRTLILTNAAGSLNTEFTPGSLMVITDHINLIGVNPLIGPNDDRFGPRFPDLTSVYARRLQDIVINEANAIGLDMRRGIYAALSGPSYETPAEIHMVRTLGADAVGMSTVPEAIVARHMNMEVIGISCITNLAAGVSNRPVDHSQVIATGERVRAEFTELLRRVVTRLE
ncbi:MAG: purine-nucleoside phosphorylase [Acidobacteria bacterium 13_1_40CM_3_55_6]|nr:MAG: purine-nucleoside phosphorylase [Acidobacteria bacterium 13_1_40CM_3_55_6]PYS62945.1 MAG: purine-nucleoside phosphorylase [Acidobacteriota bacterium]